MSYNYKQSYKKVNLFVKFKNRIFKIIVKGFPLNSVRKFGLKQLGYKIGNKVYIGEEFLIINTLSEKSTYLEIQDCVSIAPRVTVVLASDANWSKLMQKRKFIRGKIKLKKDCWIGTGTIILPGITIGEGAVVGAGSVVTKDVPPNSVVAGVPAKIIKNVDI